MGKVCGSTCEDLEREQERLAAMIKEDEKRMDRLKEEALAKSACLIKTKEEFKEIEEVKKVKETKIAKPSVKSTSVTESKPQPHYSPKLDKKLPECTQSQTGFVDGCKTFIKGVCSAFSSGKKGDKNGGGKSDSAGIHTESTFSSRSIILNYFPEYDLTITFL